MSVPFLLSPAQMLRIAWEGSDEMDHACGDGDAQLEENGKNILASLIPERAIQFPGNREAAAIHVDAAAGFDQGWQG